VRLESKAGCYRERTSIEEGRLDESIKRNCEALVALQQPIEGWSATRDERAAVTGSGAYDS
jgi:hypothetical protein